MSIQLNDKVKFLDEEGGGVVTRIIDHVMVEVTTPDGFSFPYQIKDLVKPEDNSNASKLFKKGMSEYDNIPKVKEPEASFNPSKETPLQFDRGDVKPEHFAAFLAYIPRDQYKLVFGNMDVFFMNVSNLSMYFVLFREEETGFKLVSQGRISPFSKVHISEISRDDLGSWEKVVLQIILLTDNVNQLHGPVDTKLRIRGNRFFNENSYIHSDFMREKAILFEIAKTGSIPVLHQVNQMIEKGQEEKIESKEAQKKQNREIFEHQVAKGQAVVDIHIWKLTDDELSLSAHQKLMTQMDYFQKCLESAIENRFEKVVFIHGVGTGRLKEEIQANLDEMELEHKPASMSEYGIGAIQVLIPVNYKG